MQLDVLDIAMYKLMETCYEFAVEHCEALLVGRPWTAISPGDLSEWVDLLGPMIRRFSEDGVFNPDVKIDPRTLFADIRMIRNRAAHHLETPSNHLVYLLQRGQYFPQLLRSTERADLFASFVHELKKSEERKTATQELLNHILAEPMAHRIFRRRPPRTVDSRAKTQDRNGNRIGLETTQTGTSSVIHAAEQGVGSSTYEEAGRTDQATQIRDMQWETTPVQPATPSTYQHGVVDKQNLFILGTGQAPLGNGFEGELSEQGPDGIIQEQRSQPPRGISAAESIAEQLELGSQLQEPTKSWNAGHEPPHEQSVQTSDGPDALPLEPQVSGGMTDADVWEIVRVEWERNQQFWCARLARYNALGLNCAVDGE